MPYTLSSSTLCLMEDCPRCFWLQFNKNIKRPFGIFPSLPSGMDKVLKAHFDSFRDKNELPPELKDEGIKAELFKDVALLEEWRDNFRGILWKDENDNILRGAVDNILVKDKKLIVLDYKTRGFPLKEDTAEYSRHQLDVYNFLLRKNGYETEDYGYLIFYYPKEVNENGDVVFDTRLIKMDINVKNAESLFKKAISLLKGKMPKSSEDCEFCKWVGKIESSNL